MTLDDQLDARRFQPEVEADLCRRMIAVIERWDGEERGGQDVSGHAAVKAQLDNRGRGWRDASLEGSQTRAKWKGPPVRAAPSGIAGSEVHRGVPGSALAAICTLDARCGWGVGEAAVWRDAFSVPPIARASR